MEILKVIGIRIRIFKLDMIFSSKSPNIVCDLGEIEMVEKENNLSTKA